MDDGGDVSLGLSVLVLKGGVEGAREGAAVDSLAVVVHRLYDCSLAVSISRATLSLPRTDAARLLKNGEKIKHKIQFTYVGYHIWL